MADDAKSVVDALGIGEVHLLGFSMGGMIAQEYALAYGDTLRSLVLYRHDSIANSRPTGPSR